MSALDRLAGMLRRSIERAPRPIRTDSGIDQVIASLERYTRAGASAYVPQDLQLAAVRKFWQSQALATLKEARLVSFGLSVPVQPGGPCLLEDKSRFLALIDGSRGLRQWEQEPRLFRRCYQGLVRSYFAYDGISGATTPVGRENWGDLRAYLARHLRDILTGATNPDWSVTATENPALFSKDPCGPYAAALLDGDTSVIDALCEQLGIIKASWFLRELTLAQVRHAISLRDGEFIALIPRLLEMLGANVILRDQGMVGVLDRYAAISHPEIHLQLQEKSVEWWGNPWLPSSSARWGGVRPPTREMVADWLKREFIEAFFTKLAQDGVGDRRRANFWLRYAKTMTNVQFALGAHAMTSYDKDFVALRRRMKGLTTELRGTDSNNNAFVMTMGDLVAVEFGAQGNAFYGYKATDGLPFDMSKPVVTAKHKPNSLKNSSRFLWMRHQDNIHNWKRWEDMFEATLREHFGVEPSTVPPRQVARPVQPHGTRWNTSSVGGADSPRPSSLTGSDTPGTGHPERWWLSLAYSRHLMDSFARSFGLVVDDRTNKGGSLWVCTDDRNAKVSQVLASWGFTYKAGKGWWK